MKNVHTEEGQGASEQIQKILQGLPRENIHYLSASMIGALVFPDEIGREVPVTVMVARDKDSEEDHAYMILQSDLEHLALVHKKIKEVTNVDRN